MTENYYKTIWVWVVSTHRQCYAVKCPVPDYSLLCSLQGIIALAVPLFAGTEYVEARVTLEWRNWLSAELLRGYYSQRAFYRIGQQKSIDNPDQVCAQSCRLLNTQACACTDSTCGLAAHL